MSKVCTVCERIIGDGVDVCPICGAKIADESNGSNASQSEAKESIVNENLFLCPDCGKPVSKLAFSCPNCGRPLRDSPVPKQEIKIENKREQNGCASVILGIIGILLLVSGIMTFVRLIK